MINFKKNKNMITELKEVIAKVERLNNDEQKQIAKMLKEEIEWDATLQKSNVQLAQLANEALKKQTKSSHI